jgi:hypothetical protein
MQQNCANMTTADYVARQNTMDDEARARRRRFEAIEANRRARGTWTEQDEAAKSHHDELERKRNFAIIAAEYAKGQSEPEYLSIRYMGITVAEHAAKDPEIVRAAKARYPALFKRRARKGLLARLGW